MGIIGLIVVFMYLSIYVYFEFINPEPTAHANDQVLSDAKIQPSEALAIAEPHLEEHGTFRWQVDPGPETRPLTTFIVRQKTWFSDFYFIKRHDYPAKTLRYNMFGAVKVDAQSGEVSFAVKGTGAEPEAN